MPAQGTLGQGATLTWLAGGTADDIHEITIMANGWLRVTWTNGVTSHVSPAAVKAVHGRRVSYGG